MTTLVFGDNTGDDFSGTDDSRIWGYPSFVNTNYSTQTQLEILNNPAASNDVKRVVIRFTGMSNLPSSITVSSATLALNETGSATLTIEARRLLRSWVDNQVTWNSYSTGNSWTTAGAGSDGNDRSASSSGQWLAAEEDLVDDAQMMSDIEDIASGAVTNNGWLLFRSDAANANQHNYTSSEGSDGSRPTLSVTFTEEAGGLSIPIAMSHYMRLAG